MFRKLFPIILLLLCLVACEVEVEPTKCVDLCSKVTAEVWKAEAQSESDMEKTGLSLKELDEGTESERFTRLLFTIDHAKVPGHEWVSAKIKFSADRAVSGRIRVSLIEETSSAERMVSEITYALDAPVEPETSTIEKEVSLSVPFQTGNDSTVVSVVIEFLPPTDIFSADGSMIEDTEKWTAWAQTVYTIHNLCWIGVQNTAV